MSRYEQYYRIDTCISKCDCCNRSTETGEETFSLITNNENGVGLILCSYCILMLNYRLNEFHDESGA